MKNRSLGGSILGQTCPACRSEKMFKAPVYHRHFTDMHSHCPNCHQSLEMEPGFYTGAMYVSYGLQVAIMITSFFLIRFISGEAPLWVYLTVIIGAVLALFPLLFRLSRSIWIHLMVRYRPGMIETHGS